MNAHIEVVKLLDKLRRHARTLPPPVREEFNATTDSIEIMTRGYMVPETAVNWADFGLTGIERRFLNVLNRSFGRTITYDALADGIYYDKEMGHKILNVHASKIRAKFLRDLSCPYMIETDWGIGYKLVRKEDWMPAPDRSIKRTNGAYLAALQALKAA